MKKDVFEYIWTDKKRTFLGLPWSFTRYYITENKIVIRKGCLSVVEEEIDLYKITDKKLVFPFGERLVGCATISMYSRGDADNPDITFKCIKNPREVMKILDQQINIARDKYDIRGRDMYHSEHYGE
ncbi:MAG: PH domain-containing protein [Ruminococcus sp.]|nr:PH domain-containing protein [Ruminococcus sp.]